MDGVLGNHYSERDGCPACARLAAIEREAREQVLDVDKLAKALDPVMNCDGTLDDAIALFLAAYEEATDD